MRAEINSVRTQESTVLSELRRATAADHERLEQYLNLLSPELSLPRYQRVLAGFYGYWLPLEARLERRAALLRPTFPLSPRAALLRRDLQALGLSATQLAALPRCNGLPRLQQLEELAGCLYVLEGARLGGHVVARFLRRGFGLGPACGAAFFSGDGASTRRRWVAYLEWLGVVAEGGGARALMIQAASETFQTLLRWFEQEGVGQ